MDEYFSHALDLAKAQAGVRKMEPEEIMAYAANLAKCIKDLAEKGYEEPKEELTFACDPKSSIREGSVICCICGKKMRVLTNRHLNTHGLDAKSYRELCGFKKGQPLTCNSLRRDRKATMAKTRIWERNMENHAEKAQAQQLVAQPVSQPVEHQPVEQPHPVMEQPIEQQDQNMNPFGQ